jgi:polysaccharide biosynthesis protein PelG
MAGIGFHLRQLSAQDSLTAPVASIGHATMVAAGPWLLSVTALGLISAWTADTASPIAIDGFRLVVIYAFAISLVSSAPLVLIAARLAGDALYGRRFDDVRPLFLATTVMASLLAWVIALVGYGLIGRVTGDIAVPAAACCAIVAAIWVALAFCGAVRDYWGITFGFLAGLAVAVLLTIASSRVTDNWTGTIWAFDIGLLVVLAALASRVLATFPAPVTDASTGFAALADGLLRHPQLALAGLAGAVGLWIDKWVMWMGPASVSHDMGLVHAPLYDSAMFTAYLMIIPSLALFVTHVETTFYARYRSYYAAIRNHATLKQIETQAEDLKRSTFASLASITWVQTALCLVVVMAAPTIVELTGLFFQQVGILRLGALGALFQFVFFAATSLLLFFDRQRQYLFLQSAFLVLQCAGALASLALGPAFYGLGYLSACVVSAALALVVLERTMADLTYITFVLSNASKQASVRQPLRAHRAFRPWQRLGKDGVAP